MLTPSPSIPTVDRFARHTEVTACIAEAEVSTTALAATIRILTQTGFDTSEALRSLWSEMDVLAALREVRRSLRP